MTPFWQSTTVIEIMTYDGSTTIALFVALGATIVGLIMLVIETGVEGSE